MKFRLLAVFALLLSPVGAVAQPLADRLPADALLYVGWKGTDAAGPAYEASHLKAVLDASGYRQLVDEFLPALVQRISREEPTVGMIYPVVSTIGKAICKHPTALYFGKADLQPGRPPMPRVALLCDAGPDAAALLQMIKGLLSQLPPGAPVAIAAKEQNGLVTLTVGTMSPEFEQTILGRVAGNNLATSKAFTAAMAQTQPDPTVAVYFDIEGLVGQVDQAMAGAPDGPKAQWARVREMLVLDGVKQLAIASGFDGKEWGTSAFLGAPAPRKGLMAMIDSPPLAADAMKAVPKTATYAAAAKLSLTSLFNLAREVAGQAPGGRESFDQGVAQMSQGFGLDVQKDILGAFGDDWVAYTDPSLGGQGMLGLVIVNHLADPGKAEGTFTKVEQLVFAIIREQMGKNPTIQINMQQAKSGDLTLHYLAVPFVSPAWAIKDGNLYIGLFPQTVAAGADYVSGHGPSLDENAAYKAVIAHLTEKAGGAKLTGLQFMDLPRTAPEGYATWVAISRWVASSDLFGVPSPVMMLPPLPKLMPHLAPAGSIQWSDDTGFHARAVTPFPGAEVVATDPIGSAVLAAPLVASIMLPAFSKARESANQVKCSANLRVIGQGMLLYANDNAGNYAPDLGTMVKGDYLVLSVLVCPSGHNTPPGGLKPDDQAAWANANSDYVYLGAGKKNTIGAEIVVCYEKPGSHGGGMNLLFGDGHVEFMPTPVAMDLIGKQSKATP